MIRRCEGQIHAGGANSEPGTVKAWRLVPYGKPPSGLEYQVSQTTTRDERYFSWSSQ
jgi:hypothetical protein